MNLLVKLLLSAIAVLTGAYILPGVEVSGFWVAVAVAVILSILNVIVKPILVFLTIPLTILTLGLFLLVINAVIILMTDGLIAGFEVQGFWWALGYSLILSLINSLFEDLMGRK